MAAQGTKRPTEALVVGAALRVVAGTPNPSPNSNPHPKQELSKTNASVLMIEAADDVTQGTTNGLTTLPPY